MAEFVQPPFEGDPAAKFAELVASQQAIWPGWQPNLANLDTQLLLAVAILSASDEESFTSATTEIFRWFGLYLVPDGQPEQAVAATGTVAIAPGTGADAQTIPAGTTYGAEVAGEVVGLEVVADQTFANPAVTLTGVGVVADRAGTIGNDLTGALVQVDSLGFVASVTLEAPTSGGVEEEETTTYLDRLRALLQLQAPRPIIPDNFAVMARSIVGVERAVAIDGYDPADHATYDPALPATWKERYVTVAAIDAAGEDVGPATRTAIGVYFNGDAAAGIRGKRETNFVVAVTTPTYTPISVTWSGVAWPTWAPADLVDAGNAALAEFLDPSVWGQPSFGEDRAWENVRTVTIDGLYAVLRSVEGLRNVTGLTFGQQGVTDDFSANTIANYTADAGAVTNVSITGGVMQAAANVTTNNRLIRLGDQSMRAAVRTIKHHLGGTLAGYEAGHVLRRINATNYLLVYVQDAAGASTLRIARVVAGVATETNVAITRLVINTSYWLKAWVDASGVVHAEHWLTDPALGGSATTTTTHTLAGGDATLFGAGVLAKGGVVFTPQHTSAYLDDLVVAGTMDVGPFELIGSPGPVLTRPGTIAGTVA